MGWADYCFERSGWCLRECRENNECGGPGEWSLESRRKGKWDSHNAIDCFEERAAARSTVVPTEGDCNCFSSQTTRTRKDTVAFIINTGHAFSAPESSFVRATTAAAGR